MSNFSIKPLLLIILVLSKELLVLNEEILIVLAFSIFIYLVSTNAGSLITEELDNKSKSIQNKFEIYKNIQQKTLLYLFEFHTKQELLSEKTKYIVAIKKLRVNIITNYCKAALKKRPLIHLEDLLNRVIVTEYTDNAAYQKCCINFINNQIN